MHKEGESVHLSEEEASGGRKTGAMRWVLLVGILLAIGILSVMWIGTAMTRNDPDADNVNVSAKVAAEREATDHVGAPLPAQTSSEEQTVDNNLPVVKN